MTLQKALKSFLATDLAGVLTTLP